MPVSRFAPRHSGRKVLAGDTTIVAVTVDVIADQKHSTVMILHHFVLVDFFDIVVGGDVYQTTGRRLDVADGGAFDNYVAQWETGIGTQLNTTLWVSVLLQKEENNDEEVYLVWHNSNQTWAYFGVAISTYRFHFVAIR